MTEEIEYTIDRVRVARYFFWGQFLLVLLGGLCFLGVGLILAPLYAITLGPWLTRKQAEALRYRLDGSTLRIDQGVFFLKRKGIPLDRVTDVGLSQGPLMRHFGVWSLSIQTAGAGAQIAEGMLYGVEDPEAVRDQLLKARDEAARSARA